MQATAAAVLGAVITPTHRGQVGTLPSYHEGEWGGCPPQGRLQARGEQGPWRKWEAALDRDRWGPTSLCRGVATWQPTGATLMPTGTQAMAGRHVLCFQDRGLWGGEQTGQFP